MDWIYLSPHYDDAVLSCGGMIWEQTQAGEKVEIWTAFATGLSRGQALPDFAAQLQAVWQAGGQPTPHRRDEDRAACALVGATPRYGRWPDCIYRRLPSGEALIGGGDDLWLPAHPAERALVEQVRVWLRRRLPREARLVCPISLGNHVDHRILRAAAEGLKRPLLYYADYPYAARHNVHLPDGVEQARLYRRAISPQGLAAWQASIAAHVSQISSLFDSLEDMYAKVEAFWQAGGGSQLWAA